MMKTSTTSLLAALLLAVPALALPPQMPPRPPSPSGPPQVVPRPPGPPAVHAPDEVVVSRREFEKRLDRLERLVEDTLKNAKKRADQDALRDARAELTELRRELRRASTPLPSRPDPRADWRGPSPVDERDLAEVQAAVKRQPFSKDKLAVLAEASRARHFLVQQARGLIDTFSFGKDRLEALQILAPRMLDARENGYRVLEQFSSSSDKEKARQILAKQG